MEAGAAASIHEKRGNLMPPSDEEGITSWDHMTAWAWSWAWASRASCVACCTKRLANPYCCLLDRLLGPSTLVYGPCDFFYIKLWSSGTSTRTLHSEGLTNVAVEGCFVALGERLLPACRDDLLDPDLTRNIAYVSLPLCPLPPLSAGWRQRCELLELDGISSWVYSAGAFGTNTSPTLVHRQGGSGKRTIVLAELDYA